MRHRSYELQAKKARPDFLGILDESSVQAACWLLVAQQNFKTKLHSSASPGLVTLIINAIQHQLTYSLQGDIYPAFFRGNLHSPQVREGHVEDTTNRRQPLAIIVSPKS
jgi:hypothetical protein